MSVLNLSDRGYVRNCFSRFLRKRTRSWRTWPRSWRSTVGEPSAKNHSNGQSNEL